MPEPETNDRLDDLFAPLRAPTEASVDDLRRAREAAARGARRTTRRRWTAAGATVAAALAVSALAVTVIDRGSPGTFVGEAGARELLRAAADAVRDEPQPGTWQLDRTTSVDRMTLRGQACATCPDERTVVEHRVQSDLWRGPGGEIYGRVLRHPMQVLENEPLARAGGGLSSDRERTTQVRLFWSPGLDQAGTSEVALAGPIGVVGDPAVIPADPEAIVAWATDRFRASQREAYERVAAGRPAFPPYRERPIPPAAVSGALLDVVLAPGVNGAQRAAGLSALAEQPGVELVDVPPAFRAESRLAIRLSPPPSERGVTGGQNTVVFDRESHRIVGQLLEQAIEVANRKPTISLGGGPRFRMVDKSGIQTTHEAPVTVDGPGVGPDGRRVLDTAEAREASQAVASGSLRGRAQPKAVSKIR